MDILSFDGKEIWRGSARKRLTLNANRRFVRMLRELWPAMASSKTALDALTTADVIDTHGSDMHALIWQFDVQTRGGSGRGQGRKPHGDAAMIPAPQFLATAAQIEFCREQPGGFSKYVRGLIEEAMRKA